jgi:hypothetical protein
MVAVVCRMLQRVAGHLSVRIICVHQSKLRRMRIWINADLPR